LVCVTGACYV